jgi:hypothetical protein
VGVTFTMDTAYGPLVIYGTRPEVAALDRADLIAWARRNDREAGINIDAAEEDGDPVSHGELVDMIWEWCEEVQIDNSCTLCDQPIDDHDMRDVNEDGGVGVCPTTPWSRQCSCGRTYTPKTPGDGNCPECRARRDVLCQCGWGILQASPQHIASLESTGCPVCRCTFTAEHGWAR